MSEMQSAVQSGQRASFLQRLGAYIIDAIIVGVIYGIVLLLVGAGIAYAVSIVVGLIYYTYLEGSPSGQTVGKRTLGIRVYDFRGGSTNGIGFGRAFIRYIGRIVSGIPCALGYLWMLWDKEKQTWHDKFASTVVVPVSQYPVQRWPG